MSVRPNLIPSNFELHRAGIGLVPESGHGQEGSAIYVELPSSARPLRSCTCKTSKRRTCGHLKELSKGVEELQRLFDGHRWEEIFTESLWYRLAHQLFEGSQVSCAEVRVREYEDEELGTVVRFVSPRGQELLRYYQDGPSRVRFLERTGKTPSADGYVNRAGLIERLHLFQASPEERELNRRGARTNRQSWEESFWYRLAYHCVREFGAPAVEDAADGDGMAEDRSDAVRETFHPAVNKITGDFVFDYKRDDEPIFRLVVPRSRVEPVLQLLRRSFPDQEDLSVHPVPLQSLFRVSQETELDLLVRPVIRTLQVRGQARYYRGQELARYRYGTLVFVRELGVLAELERPGQERKFRTPKMLRLQRSMVPTFAEENDEEVEVEEVAEAEDRPLRGPEVFSSYDYVQISPETLERSWYWLSVNYGFGEQSVSLEEILNGRKQGLPYLETPEGWIDLNSAHFRSLERLRERIESRGRGGRRGLRLSTSELLRFQTAAEGPVKVAGDEDRSDVVRRLLELRPSQPYEPSEGLLSKLRPYQRIGADWLRFLCENRLGGLLCDDMGLGKTHQAMALMTSLMAQDGVEGPFLVVCPTSVISHWRDKIRDFAPGLQGFVYHGPERDFAEALRVGDVIITSYGILRNDQLEFGEVSFPVAIFDEIQHIKNRDTLGYEAASQLDAEVKVGLTGTPIENSLEELKALFDLVLPGYLGSDQSFQERYGRAGDEAEGEENPKLAELRRTISPFILRRLKITVLDELPEKIEDTRTCVLSEDQVKLYRDAINTRAAPLIDRIASEGEPLPYIHIFALLNYLKQICDHPALALKQTGAAARKYRSGKWELFREILQECLDSGLKVVVFTQYLGMIELIRDHLKQLDVDHVQLTGATIDRGKIIDRFNKDADCRVFLGSLKAGGTGIDLVGGSVVIHYDRWWNAAREDQATDRVHRIGQKRAVQVFKLLTEGTLEEKIAAIIDRKRGLMETVVREDDPKLAKIFTREELLSMLEQV
jgi:superfamily II DNA or RNA helicase